MGTFRENGPGIGMGTFRENGPGIGMGTFRTFAALTPATKIVAQIANRTMFFIIYITLRSDTTTDTWNSQVHRTT